MKTDDNYRIIREAIESSDIKEVIYRGRKYYYILNPVSTGIPMVKPNLLNAIVNEILTKWRNKNVDYILTFEAMGIHIGSILSLKTGIPLIIGKKRRYADDMIEIKREKDKLYIPEIVKSSRLIIVDSIISTGKTILETIKELKKYDVDITGIYVVINRIDHGGAEKIYRESGYKVESIVDINVGKEGIKILPKENKEKKI